MPRANAIAVYGGTFSPIHRGHIEVARFLQDKFKFDEFKFLPNQSPVLDKSAFASVAHRLAMLKLALAAYPEFSIDQSEVERPTPSYMIDTLHSLKADYGSDTSITLIIGMDSFQEFHRWRDWKTILTLCNLIVLERPNTDSKLNPLLKAHIEKGEMRIITNPSDLHSGPAIPAVLGKSGCKGIGLKAFRKPLKAMDGFRERQDGFMRVCEKLLGQSPCWHSLFSAGMADSGHGGVYYCDAGSYDISSTKIRRLIQTGQPDASYLRKNVPADVLSYIQKHNLFRYS